MINDHQDTTMVTTIRCPLCGDVGVIRVSLAELRAWLDADGAMPVMAAFPSLSTDDHIRLVTGVHLDCPKAQALAEEATG